MSKIAVLGHGVVGSGVVELFYKNKEKIEKTAGHDLDIKYILDIREFPDSPYKDKFTKSIDDIVNDSEITTAAECMGGVEPAFTFTKQCLEKGISVCTSNKELVAKKGDILFKIAKEHGCNYYYEASVGGAIPIIRPLHRCLAGNDIISVSGILNGTTNFILTKMIDEGMKFDDALVLAKKLGAVPESIKELDDCDYGAYFELPQEVTLGDYMKTVREKLNGSGVISVNSKDNTLRKVFVQGGSFEEDDIPAVVESGADVVVSGEIKHHVTLLLAHKGILSIIAGHNATERVFMENLQKILEARFPNVSFFYDPGYEAI